MDFDRNPDVVAEVLAQASGKCQRCGCPAPFIRKSNGSPYLEVHYKFPLAFGGEGAVANAIALYPNCHREAHYGQPIIPPDLREKPRRPVNSNVGGNHLSQLPFRENLVKKREKAGLWLISRWVVSGIDDAYFRPANYAAYQNISNLKRLPILSGIATRQTRQINNVESVQK